MPVLTKKDIRPTTFANTAASTSPDWRTPSTQRSLWRGRRTASGPASRRLPADVRSRHSSGSISASLARLRRTDTDPAMHARPFAGQKHESEPSRFGHPIRFNRTGKCFSKGFADTANFSLGGACSAGGSRPSISQGGSDSRNERVPSRTFQLVSVNLQGSLVNATTLRLHSPICSRWLCQSRCWRRAGESGEKLYAAIRLTR